MRAACGQLVLPMLSPDPAPLMVLPPQSRAPEKASLDLPDDEMERLIRALDPARVGYGMAYAARRIAQSVCKAAPAALSPRQRNAAIRIAWRYRRQMPISVRCSLARWSGKTFS